MCIYFFDLLNFYPVTRFLVTPLLVTALLCLVTPCRKLFFTSFADPCETQSVFHECRLGDRNANVWPLSRGNLWSGHRCINLQERSIFDVISSLNTKFFQIWSSETGYGELHVCF